MGFWVFMLLMDLLIPLIMIGFGKHYCKKAPEEINNVVGYRTGMSMKNNDTWKFAHNYFGKIWYISGLILFLLSIIVMILVLGKGENTIGFIGGIICFVQMFPLIGAIVPTEIALRRVFDKNGNRR